MATVTFDPRAFQLQFPELAATVTAATGAALFTQATLFLDPSDYGRVQDPAQRAALLNLIVAHLAALQQRSSGDGGSGIVGRVTNGSEGSVAVGFDNGPASASSAWWMQTQYGATYWAATAQYRTFVPFVGISNRRPSWP